MIGWVVYLRMPVLLWTFLSELLSAFHRWEIMFSFSFVSRSFLIYTLISLLTHCIFSSMLFGLHVCLFFLFFSLEFICSFVPLWLVKKKMLDTISILLNLLALVLWPSMWRILENISCVPEKNVHSAVFGCNILYIPFKFNWSIVI